MVGVCLCRCHCQCRWRGWGHVTRNGALFRYVWLRGDLPYPGKEKATYNNKVFCARVSRFCVFLFIAKVIRRVFVLWLPTFFDSCLLFYELC